MFVVIAAAATTVAVFIIITAAVAAAATIFVFIEDYNLTNPTLDAVYIGVWVMPWEVRISDVTGVYTLN